MKHKKSNWTKKVESYYDGEADKWVIDSTKEPNRYYHNSYFKVLFNNNISGDNALDIGCGAGTFTFELSKYNFKKIYALDISEKMLFYLNKEKKKRKIKNVEPIKSNITNIPFKDNNFDFIVSVGVMECLKDKEKALKEIYRVLKPGGTASIRWLNKEGLWGFVEFIERIFSIPSSPFSYRLYSKVDDAILSLKNTGFRIKAIKGMVILPFFVFPFPISWFFETLLIKTKLAYKIEGIKKTRKNFIRRFYYSFCTEIKK